MTTLADAALQVIRIVNPESVTNGEATAGTATTLTDTTNLIQDNSYFDRGTLWITSGTHSGKVAIVTGHLSNKLTFSTLGSAVAVGVRYAVARAVYPWMQIKSAINEALQETHIEDEDTSLTGDGTTLEFPLPAGVYNIKRVQLDSPTNTTYKPYSTHWREQNGSLKFDYGYAPDDNWTIRIVSRVYPPELTTYSDTISDELDPAWVRYKAAEKLLLWGMGVYGGRAEYRIEERMNMVLERLKKLYPRRGAPDVQLRTAGQKGL